MPFTHDLFISYAHLDDISPIENQKGWIELLHKRLSVRISQALGYDVTIWRDGHDLQGNDELQGAISEGITRSLLLVPIISPRYVQSDWCNREIAAFYASAPPPQTAALGFHTRVFKVSKTPLPDHLKNLELEQLRKVIGYQFYQKDETDGEFHEFSSDPTDKSYWTMLDRLVSDLTKTLIQLKYSSSSPSAVVTPSETASSAAIVAASPTPVAPDGAIKPKIVYLAETTSDLAKERELVRDELRQRGHDVLPEQKIPLAEVKQTEAAVRADLARCALSVHLIGSRYGSPPEDDDRSIVRIQEELAAERAAADSAFLRLLWMPPGLATPALEISDKRQRALIEELHAQVTAGAELLQTSVEDLKTRIVEKLNPPQKTPRRADRQAKLKQVYLICENSDRPLVRPIKEYLFEQNLEVITWLDRPDTDSLMDYHRKNLRECDAALVYFGAGDEPWVYKNLDDLEKAYGYGREEDWLASAVYVGGLKSDQKEDFLTHKVTYVIRNFSSFNPKDLNEFVSAVQAAGGAH